MFNEGFLMSDWMYEATYAQARLETTSVALDKANRLVEQYETALKKISTEPLELTPAKAHMQCSDFQHIARSALNTTLHQTQKEG
jgi:hypothetical protein